MNFHLFNFAHEIYLWALALIPMVWLMASAKRWQSAKNANLERFADKNLLPHLVSQGMRKRSSGRGSLCLWSAIWAFGVLAVAGPRWDVKEVTAYKPNRSLVIALDLAKSMDAGDVKPSRLIRARQDIQDILDENPGVNIGLIGFGDGAHLITPITEDKGSIHYLLGALRTDLVSATDSRLGPALRMAGEMLSAVPGQDKKVLVMSDGEFSDKQDDSAVKELVAQGIEVSAMGFGASKKAATDEVAAAPFDGEALAHVSTIGRGSYLDGSGPVGLATPLLGGIYTTASAVTRSSQVIQDWEPRFYVFLIPMLLLLLPLFRRRLPGAPSTARGAVAAAAIGFVLLPRVGHAEAVSTPLQHRSEGLVRLFENRDTQGKDAFEAHDYDAAIQAFKDPYRQGVAQYRAGQYANAAKSFRASHRPELRTDAQYNLGNALAQDGKYQEAISAYQQTLKAQPQHRRAKINLKIVQDLLQKQKQEQNQKQPDKNHPDKNQSDQKQIAQNQAGKSGQSSQQQQPGAGQSQGGKGSAQKQSAPGTQQGQASPGANGDSDNTAANGAQSAGSKSGHTPEKSAQQQAKSSLGQVGKKGDKPSEDVASAGSGQPAATGSQVEKPSPQAGTVAKPGAAEAKGEPIASSLTAVREAPLGQDTQVRARKSSADIDADQWLNRITSDPHEFLHNQFAVESLRRKKAKEE